MLCFHFADKGLSSQSYGFSSSHVWMWELDRKEGWGPKNSCFWTVVLEKTNFFFEKTLKSPLDCKQIKPVHPKGNQPWIFIGKTDAEAEAPILWPLDAKSWLTGKDPGAGKDWGEREKGVGEDEMMRKHNWVNGHEFEQTLGDSEVHRSLVCCSPWVCKESHTTEWLNNNHNKPVISDKAPALWLCRKEFPQRQKAVKQVKSLLREREYNTCRPTHWSGRVKILHNLLLVCLCYSTCSLQSLDHIGHAVSESGDLK